MSCLAFACIFMPCLALPCYAMSCLLFASILRNKKCPTRVLLSTIYTKISYDNQDDDDGPEDYVGITEVGHEFEQVIILDHTIDSMGTP